MKFFENRKINISVRRPRTAFVLVIMQLITACAGFSGCGLLSKNVPELIEPGAVLMAYRPAQKRELGRFEQLFGVVVPTEYPCFAANPTMISEIMVGIGDKVEKGDVIARGVGSEISEQISSLESQIDSLSRKQEMLRSVTEKTYEKYKYERNIYEFANNAEGVIAKDIEAEKNDEELRFQTAMIESNIASLRESIEELQSRLEEVSYVAPHSGVVSFVKDISKSNFINSNENIVVIADYDDLYIESSDVNFDKYKFKDYECKWAYIHGKRVDIVEHDYTNEELSFALSVKKNPYIAFDVPGEKLDMGCDVALYFMEKKSPGRVAVGIDSIYQENGEDFVYVQGKDGENERRVVELGITDGDYAEVLSGVEEGEMVFYRNTVMVPETYEEVEVKLSDYTEECTTDVIEFAYPYYNIHLSEITGTCRDVYLETSASKGDDLYTIDSEAGSAEVEDARIKLLNLENERNKQITDYQNARNDLVNRMQNSGGFIPEEHASDTDALMANMYLAERSQLDIDILDIMENYNSQEYAVQREAYEKEYNNIIKGTPSSEYTVTAEEDCRIGGVNISKETTVEKGTYILAEQYRNPDDEHSKYLAIMSGKNSNTVENTARIGQKVVLVKDKQKWEGRCIGINGVDSRFCLFTRDGKQYSTYSASFEKKVPFQFYVEMDSKVNLAELKDTEIRFSGREMRQVIVLPSLSVKTEVSQLNGNEKYYVWKKEAGMIVKEYVEKYKTDTNNGKIYILRGVEVGDVILK